MSTDFPIAPKVAEQANYPAGGYAWSGQPCKVAPDATFQDYGIVPGGNVPAEDENYFRHALKELAKDAQRRAGLKIGGQGSLSRNTGGLYVWAPDSKALIGSETISGFFKCVSRSPNMGHVRDSTDALNGVELCGAVYSPGGGAQGYVVPFEWGMLGSTGNYIVVDDHYGRNVATKTPPQAGAKYHYGCTDGDTGNVVILSAGAVSGTTQIGWAWGNPNTGLTWDAPGAGTGWTNDVSATLASGNGQTRVFSPGKTWASVDGGDNPTAVENMSYTGASAPATGTGFRACWDPVRSRWVYSTADLSSGANLEATTALWTSANGKDWTFLCQPTRIGGTSQYVLVDIKYHEGWLWGLAICAPSLGDQDHYGLEVVYSMDGGATWERPGITVSMCRLTLDANANRDYLRQCRIEVCDTSLLFQTAINAAGWTGTDRVEYVSVLTG